MFVNLGRLLKGEFCGMKYIYQCPCSTVSSLPLLLIITHYLIFIFLNRHCLLISISHITLLDKIY
jgi:hypothetical protein